MTRGGEAVVAILCVVVAVLLVISVVCSPSRGDVRIDRVDRGDGVIVFRVQRYEPRPPIYIGDGGYDTWYTRATVPTYDSALVVAENIKGKIQ